MSYKPFTTEYTLQIIDDIKEYLEETNKDQTTLDTLDLCHLIGEIEKLNNRNRELFAEKNKLNNIINELEKWVEEDENKAMITFETGRCFNYHDIINKIEELKGSDK